MEGPVPPSLVLVCGLPGSGKSHFSRLLAGRLSARHLSSDALRTKMGLRGDYSSAAIAAVYERMMSEAGRALGQGRPVVLDGTFSSRRFREWAARTAERAAVPMVVVRLTADEETTLRRVAKKRALTEAGPEAYRLLKEHFEPVEGPHLVLDSSRQLPEELVDRFLEYLQGADPAVAT